MAAQEFWKMWEPKISKLKDEYTSSSGLVFHSWLKEIHFHVEDQQLTQREAILLVRDFITEHAQDEVQFYMGMVVEEEQSFKGLVEHLPDVLQCDKTFHKLISNFYGQAQKTRETEDAFANDFKVLARIIIAQNHPFIWRPVKI